jgi:predicted O-methyltransferase YrrM
MTTFTQDWFSHNIPGLESIVKLLPSNKDILEIGSFEGRSTCWLLENVLADDGTIYCIDTFSGSEEHKEMGLDFSGVKDRFKANTEEVKKPNQSIGIMDMPSHIGISKLMSDERIFDLVYVDGSHMAPDVMSDACMAFHLLETKGIMVFDDYLWKMEQNMLHTPKVAIDMFTTLFKERAQIVMVGYQVAIQKV